MISGDFSLFTFFVTKPSTFKNAKRKGTYPPRESLAITLWGQVPIYIYVAVIRILV